jgi:hypothetical protein
MGIFGKRNVSDEAIFCSLILTFAQSIEAVEKRNKIALNEAWDLFINTAGLLTDRGLISEAALETVVYRGNFPDNHQLTLDLVGIRSQELENHAFVDKNKDSLVTHFTVRKLAARNNWNPKDFSDVLNEMTIKSFPTFGRRELDQAFLAVIGIYMRTLVDDLASDHSSMSTRVAKRVMGYEFALQWLADWNLAE